MSSEFAVIFSQLRRDRNISQRQVAADLKISQALLSHYENGLREPRFDFVVKVCEYYGVSADYILGRTAARENPMTSGNVAADSSDNELDKRKNECIRCFISATTVMFSLFAETLGEEAVGELYDYLGAAAYKIFRNIYLYSGEHPESQLKIPEYCYASVCDAAMTIADIRLRNRVFKAAQDGRLPELTKETLQRDFPTLSKTFEEMIVKLDSEITKYMTLMEM